MTLSGTDQITSLLTTFLNVQSKRAEVTSANIANAETPGYHAQEVDFATYLNQAAENATAPFGQGASPLQDGTRVVEQALPEMIRMDGNTVDMQREMSTLSETGMQFLAGTQMLQSRLRPLRSAIREGR
ncbi:MAG: flagellar basal body rod protein FlgB [Pyrinomonadaceae bacterium]